MPGKKQTLKLNVWEIWAIALRRFARRFWIAEGENTAGLCACSTMALALVLVVIADKGVALRPPNPKC
jgi:hypothetical protein